MRWWAVALLCGTLACATAPPQYGSTVLVHNHSADEYTVVYWGTEIGTVAPGETRCLRLPGEYGGFEVTINNISQATGHAAPVPAARCQEA